MHQQKALVEFNLGRNDLSFSEQHASECLSIPCHPNMTRLGCIGIEFTTMIKTQHIKM